MRSACSQSKKHDLCWWDSGQDLPWFLSATGTAVVLVLLEKHQQVTPSTSSEWENTRFAVLCFLTQNACTLRHTLPHCLLTCLEKHWYQALVSNLERPVMPDAKCDTLNGNYRHVLPGLMMGLPFVSCSSSDHRALGLQVLLKLHTVPISSSSQSPRVLQTQMEAFPAQMRERCYPCVPCACD